MKRITGILLLIVGGLAVRGQNMHIGLLAGVSNYQGDLQSKRFTFSQSHFAAGIGGLYELSDKLFIRGYFTYGTVSATDKNTVNQIRNLSFSSPVYELHVGLEYDLLNLYEQSVTPYIFAGVGGYHFNPSAVDKNGDKVYLQPLGTEGQGYYLNRNKYTLTQLSIPFGGGLKFPITENVRLRLEVGLRKLFTDYLDDVSTTYPNPSGLSAEGVSLSFRSSELKPGLNFPTGDKRGNPSSKDWYYFSAVSISFRLMPGRERNHSGKGNLGCPVKVY